MKYTEEDYKDKTFALNDINHNNLRADCGNCFGFCCVALYFSASEGFPVNKAAGNPCPNLQQDFRCKVHKNLKELGLKGCISYECFGAGQRVAQVTYGGQDWRKIPKSAKQMYEVFLVMWQLHEMLWYLNEALTLKPASQIQDELDSVLVETESLTLKSPDSLLKLDAAGHRAKVNALLLKTSELVRAQYNKDLGNFSKHRKVLGPRTDFIGKDLRKTDLRGQNLRGACFIAADLRGVDLSGTDLIGADLRDANIKGANLADSIFLTQAQINSAKGDSNTKLPNALLHPMHWEK